MLPYAFMPALSPNGKWLAYTSLESAHTQVYLTEFPEAREKWQVSVGAGYDPCWSPDGKRLFFKAEKEAVRGRRARRRRAAGGDAGGASGAGRHGAQLRRLRGAEGRADRLDRPRGERTAADDSTGDELGKGMR